MKIFISYSSKTRPLVAALAEDLQALGYEIWFDRELTGGREWWADILSQIRNCDLFVFALTPESIDSGPCRLEYTYANDLDKRILPVMLTNTDFALLSSALQKIQVVDYRAQSKAQLIALQKALVNLPPAHLLPEPLPPEPGIPLSPLAALADRITAPSLNMDEQKAVLHDLVEMLDDPKFSKEAMALLKRFREREDLIARIDREIGEQLKKRDPRGTRLEPRVFANHDRPVLSVAFAPDFIHVLTASADHQAILWEAATGKAVRRFSNHTVTVSYAAFSADGKYVLTCSDNAALWDLSTGSPIQVYDQSTFVVGAALAADGKSLITGNAYSVILWDINRPEPVKTFEHDDLVTCVTFSPDSRHVFAGGATRQVHMWDTDSGTEVRRFSGHVQAVSAVAVSPDERYLLTGSWDTTARLWNIETGGEVRQFEGQNGPVNAVAFSPDGKYVLTGGSDSMARLYQVANAELRREFSGHEDAVTCVAFSPDGRYLLTGSADMTARLWESGIS